MINKSFSLLIQELSSIILNQDAKEIEIKNSIDKVHLFFTEITGISGFDNKIENLVAIPTSKGKALGLNHAAQCLLDYKRTTKFFNGIVNAIKKAQNSHPEETIKILYAGCGPYATFMTLIAPLFSSSKIQFSLLDINEKSLTTAKNLIEKLGLLHHVDGFYCDDATTFKIPKGKQPHIVISETLDALLFRECYVPILFNLLPQLQKSAIVIPENIILKSNYILKDINNKAITKEDSFGEILNVKDVVNTCLNLKNEPLISKKLIFENAKNYSGIIIDTLVNIYDDINLLRGESSLTLPLEMLFDKPFNYKSIVFTYQIEPTIELKYSLQQ